MGRSVWTSRQLVFGAGEPPTLTLERLCFPQHQDPFPHAPLGNPARTHIIQTPSPCRDKTLRVQHTAGTQRADADAPRL
jgi:hypothetical protein